MSHTVEIPFNFNELIEIVKVEYDLKLARIVKIHARSKNPNVYLAIAPNKVRDPFHPGRGDDEMNKEAHKDLMKEQEKYFKQRMSDNEKDG